MTFADLLRNLGSYLDFSKRLATTIPGLVMACALVLLTGSQPQWLTRSFACGRVRRLQVEAQAAQQALAEFDASAHSEALSVDRRHSLRAQADALRSDYFLKLSGVSQRPPLSRVEDMKAALKALEDFDASPEGSAWKQYRDTAGKGSAAVAEAERRRDASLRELAANKLLGQCDQPTDWATLIQDLLQFGLLGFALGVVLDPVNKALFLQLLPSLPPLGNSSPRSLGKVARFFATPFISSHAHEKRTRLGDRTAQFYIGRGLITDGEYQALIDSHYRFSELTTGLALPVIFSGLGWFLQRRALGDGWTGAVYFVISLVLAAGLARIGQRRHIEFRNAVADLVGGREARLKEQKDTERRRVDLTQLQLLVREAEAIRKRPPK